MTMGCHRPREGPLRRGFGLRAATRRPARLTTVYNGNRPAGGYNPMKKQGAIILGIGGDNTKRR